MSVKVRRVYFLFYSILFTALPQFRVLLFSMVFSPEARSIRGNNIGMRDCNLEI